MKQVFPRFCSPQAPGCRQTPPRLTERASSGPGSPSCSGDSKPSTLATGSHAADSFHPDRPKTGTSASQLGAPGLTTRNKKLLGTSASLLVTSALLVVTRTLLGALGLTTGNKKLLETINKYWVHGSFWVHDIFPSRGMLVPKKTALRADPSRASQTVFV